MNVKIAGIVLAGGQSLRMGEDKAQLTIDQHTLLSRAVKLLQQSGFDDCFVSGNYEGFNCIIDQHQALGPLAGLAACVAKLLGHYDALFIIPVDMPLLIEKDCHYLLQHFTGEQGIYYEDATFPMILPLNQALFDYLAMAIASTNKKDRSLYRLLKTLDIKAINKKQSDAFRFENTNTPEQWQQCLATYAMIQSNKINKKD